MDLKTFKQIVDDYLKLHQLNLSISGVALVQGLTSSYWSASLIHSPGTIPPPSIKNIPYIFEFFKEHPLGREGFELSHINSIKFIMNPDLSASRWQIQWLYK